MTASTWQKGLLVAAFHVAIVWSLGAKLLVDRATRPRVWARTAPTDPNLPIRGRYVRLRIEATPAADVEHDRWLPEVGVALSAREGRLVATPQASGRGLAARLTDRGADYVVIVDQPLAYFIPEHVADPSRRASGEELWVEVTIPRLGPPRPIRLGVKKDGVLTALEVN